jgi:Domain of unknown function (DUF222)
MSESPVPRDPGRDADPPGVSAGRGDYPRLGSPDLRLVPSSPEWPEWVDDEGYLAAADEDPGDLEEDEDLDNAPPPGLDDAQLADMIAEAREITAGQAAGAAAVAAAGRAGVMGAVGSVLSGRRGPGMPGSAGTFPGEYLSPAAGFATGKPLDTAPGGPVLAQFAEEAAGDGDRYRGASDDELLGVICAWDRAEANASARKHAAVAELLRRRPAPGAATDRETGLPAEWDEFTGRELGAALAVSAGEAGEVLGVAAALEIGVPGTRAGFRSGVLTRDKARIIAAATGLLDRAEARAAEAMVLDRAGSLTPAGLRAAIAQAVMEVNPEKAKQRREQAAGLARVQRWAEGSGNAGLTGRELPPAEVLAADQRITWWARQLRKAGLDGGMDLLRARAFLDILLGADSRPQPRHSAAGQDGSGRDGSGPGSGSGPDGSGRDVTSGQDGAPGQDEPCSPGPGSAGPGGIRVPVPAGPLAGMIPPGFAGRVNLTAPLGTLLELAGRPGEMPGLGPLDPDLTRDLAAAAARTSRSTWCLTITDSQGHAIGHGCARREPAHARTRPATRRPAAGGGPDPPGAGPFTFSPAGQPGPPGGYGTWRLCTGTPGQRDLLIAVGPLPAGDCDHRHEAKGHDPGVMLRHLAQVRHARCTGPGCRRPAERCDFEHNIPHEAGGRTCLCNGNPTCRHDHRAKQDPRWNAEQLPDGHIRWTTPSGRQYTTEPTRYPI